MAGEQGTKVIMFAEVNVHFREAFHAQLGSMKSFKQAGCVADGESWIRVVQVDGMQVFPKDVIVHVEMIPSRIAPAQ